MKTIAKQQVAAVIPQKAIPIHEAKANFSKYVQQAKTGTPVYMGAYGKAEVMLVVVPKPAKQSWVGMFEGISHTTDEEWEASETDMEEMMEEYYQKIDAEED